MEQKMGLQMRLLHVSSLSCVSESDIAAADAILEREVPDYTRLVRSDGIDPMQMWNEVRVMSIEGRG